MKRVIRTNKLPKMNFQVIFFLSEKLLQLSLPRISAPCEAKVSLNFRFLSIRGWQFGLSASIIVKAVTNFVRLISLRQLHAKT